MSRLLPWALIACLTAADWPQFHGPNASGVSSETAALPEKLGPETNVLWKIPVPSGHASPVVVGDRLYLAGTRDKTMVTIAIDKATGQIVWQREVQADQLEKIHQVGTHAQSTPAADRSMVATFFGSAGLYAYDREGKPLWHAKIGPFKNDFGAGSSPILAGDRLILNQDHDTDSFLVCFDKTNGKELWRVDRSEFPRGYATPVIWDVNGKKQVVIAGTLRVTGYDLATGREVWVVHGMARIQNMTPTIGPDNLLYLAAWSPGGDPGERIEVDTYDEMIAKYDTNKNGSFEPDEVPEGPLKQRFSQIDRNKDGHISKTEFEEMRKVFLDANNVCVAIKPGGTGDITKTHIVWKQAKGLPYVPSPVFYKGHLYMVKNGGLVQVLDAKTGEIVSFERAYGRASYYASPVIGDGKIYLVDQKGDLSVLSAEPKWKQLSRAKLGEEVFSTPAIADGRIYIRTAGHLYCFGNSP